MEFTDEPLSESVARPCDRLRSGFAGFSGAGRALRVSAKAVAFAPLATAPQALSRLAAPLVTVAALRRARFRILRRSPKSRERAAL